MKSQKKFLPIPIPSALGTPLGDFTVYANENNVIQNSVIAQTALYNDYHPIYNIITPVL